MVKLHKTRFIFLNHIPTASPGPMIVDMVNETSRSNITSSLCTKTRTDPSFSVTELRGSAGISNYSSMGSGWTNIEIQGQVCNKVSHGVKISCSYAT